MTRARIALYNKVTPRGERNNRCPAAGAGYAQMMTNE